MKLELEDGKYTYIEDDGVQKALRYGESWRDLAGDKFVGAMASEIETLRQRVKELEASRDKYMDLADLKTAELATLKQGQGEPVAWLVKFTSAHSSLLKNRNDRPDFENGSFVEHDYIPPHTSAPTIPEEGEPEIRWVYRADGKAHIAGRPTTDDLHKLLSTAPKPEGDKT